MPLLLTPALLVGLLVTACGQETTTPDAATCLLFATFHGNGEDGLHLRWSEDGMNWNSIQNDKSFLQPAVGEEKIMRDPCLIRGPDGIFHLVWTSAWRGKTVGYARSKDLIHWSEQMAIPVMAHEPRAQLCWAPEIRWDEQAKEYLIYWSSALSGETTPGQGDPRYYREYATTTTDFKTFTPTRLFFDPHTPKGASGEGGQIDSNSIKIGDKYYLFYKQGYHPGGIRYAVAEELQGPYSKVFPMFAQDNDKVIWEGPSAIQIGDYCVVYTDRGMSPDRPDRMGAWRSKDMIHWEDISLQMRFPPRTLHGSVLRVERSLVLSLAAAQPPAEKLARPTPEQAAWHDCELGVFIHLGPATWQDSEYDTLATPLDKLNPDRLDTEQWVAAAETMGAKYIVFVAKHTGGFCWWQTDTTDYGVRNIPWRGGQGDVMKDLAESCRKRGLKLGVYLSPQDVKFGASGGGRCANPEAQKRYDKIFRRQLTELLSRYGEMFEVWFDGSSITDVGDILRQYCPKAMVFQGPYATIRWVGNEDGHAPYPNWNSLPLARAKSGVSTGADGRPDGDAWMPNECDARIRSTWFWNSLNANTLKSVDQLMAMYYQSVGRGAVLLLNIAPDTTGLMPAADVKRAAQFGAEIRRRFGESLAETSGKGEIVELDLRQPTRLDHVITMENIVEGERVREYAIEGLVSGEWKELCRGSSIGHKKIDQFSPTEASKVRLRVVKSAAEPQIRKLAVYAVCDTPTAATAPASANVAQKVWEWSPETVGKEWKTVEMDLTPFCRDACVYQIAFNSAGGSPLELQSLQYVFDGTVLPEFIQKAAPDGTRYYLTVTGLGKPLGLRAVVRVSGGNKDSQGTVTIRKGPP